MYLSNPSKRNGLMDIQGAAFGAVAAINTARGATIPPLIDAITERYKAAAASTLGMDGGIANINDALDYWVRNTSSLPSSISRAMQDLLVAWADEQSIYSVEDVEAALTFLTDDMRARYQYVTGNTVTAVADASEDNTSDIDILFTTRDGYGRPVQFGLPETLDVVIESANAETPSLRIVGEPVVDDRLSADWPAGSGINTVLSVVRPNNGLLVNGDFDTLTDAGAPADWIIYGGRFESTVFVADVETQRLRISNTPTSGVYYLLWTDRNGKTYPSAAIDYDANGSTVQRALRAIPGLEQVSVSTTGTSPNYTHLITLYGVTGRGTIFGLLNQTDRAIIKRDIPYHGHDGSYRGRALRLQGDGTTKHDLYAPLYNLQPNTVYFCHCRLRKHETLYQSSESSGSSMSGSSSSASSSSSSSQSQTSLSSSSSTALETTSSTFLETTSSTALETTSDSSDISSMSDLTSTSSSSGWGAYVNFTATNYHTGIPRTETEDIRPGSGWQTVYPANVDGEGRVTYDSQMGVAAHVPVSGYYYLQGNWNVFDLIGGALIEIYVNGIIQPMSGNIAFGAYSNPEWETIVSEPVWLETSDTLQLKYIWYEPYEAPEAAFRMEVAPSSAPMPDEFASDSYSGEGWQEESPMATTSSTSTAFLLSTSTATTSSTEVVQSTSSLSSDSTTTSHTSQSSQSMSSSSSSSDTSISERSSSSSSSTLSTTSQSTEQSVTTDSSSSQYTQDLRFAVVTGVGGALTKDTSGVGNEMRINMAAVSEDDHDSAWFTFRLEPNNSNVHYLRIHALEPLESGQSLYIDEITVIQARQLYAGGPFMQIFGGNVTPNTATDSWTISVTNDWNGGLQTWYHRMFGIGDYNLSLPTTGQHKITDGAIAGG